MGQHLYQGPLPYRIQHQITSKTDRKLSSAQALRLHGGNLLQRGIAIGGIEDHVHSLVELPPTMSLSKALNLLKSNSSGWMSEQRRGFGWQEGYGAFAVSVSNLAAVKRYVLNQQAHHRKMTFEDEFITLLEKPCVHPIPGTSSISAAPAALNSSSSLTQRLRAGLIPMYYLRSWHDRK